ncbi:phage baseplate assembly protein V [Sorangium sp. So ce281]|uniref:phage baseplate assembly protein V n=1 Tax=unclassified Sorangium TaxID=2621164 RepID=UPI003F627D2D
MQSDKQLGVTIGTVVDRNDPQNIGRVMVSYPTHANMKTDWTRVMVPYGGAGRGFKAIPEVGDEVVVGFEQGNSMRPIVLGSVYSQKNRPPMQDDLDVRVLQSPRGHRITLADAPRDGKITLESGDVRLGGANALKPAVLGDALNRLLTQLLNQLALHTHGSAAGPTTPPVNALAFTGQISGLASLLSQIVKLER